MKKVLWSCFLASLVLPLATATPAVARPPFACPDVYAPVLCSNGQVYSNSCYASIAGATGCVPHGIFTEQAVAAAAQKLCPGGFECLDVWDPVICSNGVVYSNACYARRACATGCTPYGAV